jgi:hypothetical protein
VSIQKQHAISKLTPRNLQFVLALTVGFGRFLPLGQLQRIADIADSPQVPQCRPFEEVIIEAPVWEALACSAAMLEVSTESLHWIGPIAPHRTPSLNAVGEVKKRMDGERADWEPFLVTLIVDPVPHDQHTKE